MEGLSLKNSEPLKISVAISTKNREHDIHKCMKSILIQSYEPYEIIIIDSSDTNDLESKLNLLCEPKNIVLKYVHAEVSLTCARNIAIEKCTGDVILFIDDDVILDKGYIKEIVKVFYRDAGKKIAGVTGNIVAEGVNAEEVKKSFLYVINRKIVEILTKLFLLPRHGNGRFQPSGFPTLIYSKNINDVIDTEFLFGCNMAFRKEIVDEFKFDENLYGYCDLEDDDFSYRISRAHRNVYTPFAKLIHNVSPVSRVENYAKAKMRMENHYYLFKKSLPQTLKYKFAFWWSVIGLFVIAVVGINKGVLKGLMDGLINIKRNKIGDRKR